MPTTTELIASVRPGRPSSASPADKSSLPKASLYSWSLLQFQVWPVNVHEVDHSTETDWAKKEIAGAAVYREWVGENDEELYFRGRLFPYRIGGKSEIEVLETYRRNGIAGLMLRGDGQVMGWFVCSKLIRTHQHIGPDGVGQQINFEAIFMRVPAPDAESYFPVLWGSVLTPN